MSEDLVSLLRKSPGFLRACCITRVEVGHNYTLRLVTDSPWEILCRMAVDFSIRPPHPGIIMGGPAVRILEKHSLLGPHLQQIPGGDGDEFDPPRHFKILIFDQSYVIAESFELLRRSQEPI